MTLPASGPISLSMVSVELGRASNATTSLGETAVANLSHGNAVGPFGPTVSMSSLYGKSAGGFAGSLTFDSNAATIGNKIQSASLSFNSDGTTSFSGYVSGSTAWWAPTTTGIGSSYWVKVVYNTFTNLNATGGTSGTWYRLTSGKTYTIANNATTTETAGTANIYFSTAGTDATIVGPTGNWSWDLGSAH